MENKILFQTTNQTIVMLEYKMEWPFWNRWSNFEMEFASDMQK